MTGKLARRRHRLEKRARWRAQNEGRIVAALAALGVEGKVPRELVLRLAAAPRQRMFPAALPDPELSSVVRAMERELAAPHEGGLGVAEFFELVVPALARVGRELEHLPCVATLAHIARVVRDRFETYEKALVRRLWRVAATRSRLDGLVVVPRCEDGRVRLRAFRPRERTFSLEGAPRRVWHVFDWPEGPVYVQQHALARVKERSGIEPGFEQFFLLTSLAEQSIVRRQGDELFVELREGPGGPRGYLVVSELSGAFLVRTFLAPGMRNTPEELRRRTA